MTLPRYKTGDILKPGEEEYRVLDLIGKGGMACVYKVYSLKTKDILAVKLLDPQPGWDEEAIKVLQQRMRLESDIMDELKSHPRIVRLIESGDGYIVMEHLGACLHQVIHDYNHPLTPKEALTAGTQIADALTALHEIGYRHRDLKPENVLTRKINDVVLADFGLAKAAAGPALTQQGVIAGTFTYLAPEQLFPVRFNDQDFRTDIYQFGVLCYELLTGTLPFDDATIADPSPESITHFYAHKIINESSLSKYAGRDDIPHPSDFPGKDIPKRLSDLVIDCLQLDPKRRPERIIDVRDGLNHILFELYDDFVVVGSHKRSLSVTPEILIPHRKVFQGRSLYGQASVVARNPGLAADFEANSSDDDSDMPKDHRSGSYSYHLPSLFSKQVIAAGLVALAALFGPSIDSIIGRILDLKPVYQSVSPSRLVDPSD